jgi:hypothetical protein
MHRFCALSFGVVSCVAPAVASAATPATATASATATATSPTTAVEAGEDVGAVLRFVDEGELLAALQVLSRTAREPARIAVVVDDADTARRTSIERALVRALREQQAADIVTPALVRARLGAQAAEPGSLAAAGFAADHVLVAAVAQASGPAVLQLKLLSTARGEVVGNASVALAVDGGGSTVRARSADVACADLADVFAEAVEGRGVAVVEHRIGVVPVQATGAAKEAQVDRFLQNALASALRARGFLVVERAELGRAMEQLSLAELTGTEDAGALGQMLGAQSLVVASVSDAGDHFVVNARVVGVEGGDVLGAASASLVREGVVSMAAVETRSPAQAALQSAVAPGWGQAYNGEGTKAVIFGVSTYGALLGTVTLAGSALWSWREYDAVRPGDGVSAEQARVKAVALREQTNTLWSTTAIAGAVTASLWSFGIADALISAPDD